jgi:hypothetical protein
MIRVTIEMLPGGDAADARVIGVIEMARVGPLAGTADYVVAAMTRKPFAAPLLRARERGRVSFEAGALAGVVASADADMTIGVVEHHERALGVHALLARALRVLRLEDNP